LKIGKRFTFDAAHRIPHHEGKCRQQHGHTYTVDVEVSGAIKSDGPVAGMVRDFGDLKAVWRERLEPLLDHRDLNDSLARYVMWTTAELIAVFIRATFADALEVPLKAVTVKVWETPSSYALSDDEGGLPDAPLLNTIAIEHS
jgi:6-pyruvoyltetrahydropterin/6-carboxytetrahydropterin synthase